jgi:16S rRNA (guanine966-N2)-methyltransferase
MPTYKNQVRIIGGTHKRRVIRFPALDREIDGFRPTPDRVRETLFNWLGQDLLGKRCLDVFAGSGALAFEAASRNASTVIALETSRAAAKAIAENQAVLQLANLKLLQTDAFAFLASATDRFDVIFLDPPFAADWWDRLAPLIARIANEGALVYCESAKELSSFGDFVRLKHARAGMVHYHLFAASQAGRLEGDGP